MRFRAFFLCCSLWAQVAQQANSGYKTPEGRARVGEMLAKESRVDEVKPRELLQAIGVRPGMTVADIGTGVGFMLPYFAEAVGPSGKVIAEDIFPDFLERAKARVAENQLGNVEFVLGGNTDPKLPESAVDLALTLDVYHHFDYPDKMLAGIRRALKPNGRYAVVDMHKNQAAMPDGRALQHIRLPAKEAIREIESNGFRLVEQRDHVPNRLWLAIFEKR